MTDVILRGTKHYGLELPETAAPAFRIYYNMLVQRNRVMNLTAITGETEAARLHFLDSLALLTLADFRGASVIDVGTGAGFPGLPLRIAEPTIRLTLMDAQQKRVDFLSDVVSELSLDGVECVHARAEEAAFEKGRRGGYDIAVSRAVARLNVLCELCMPFVRKGGLFIAMKGAAAGEELTEAAAAIEKLGGKTVRIAEYAIPETDVTHAVVIVRKVADTPSGYPRRFAKIQKKPIA